MHSIPVVRAACRSSGLSRRQFLCTTAAGVAAAPALAASVIGAPTEAAARASPKPGRPILLKGGCVLSLDRAVGDFEQADVLIEGKKISAVQPNISAPNAQVIDAENRIVMPGFVDTHRHMWQGFLRNVLPDGSLEDYRNVVQRTFGAKMMPGRCLCRRPASARSARSTRRHLHARLVAHREFAGAHRRLHQGIAGVRRARRVRLWRRPERDRPGHGDRRPRKYPGDIARLRKQYFSSDDQLITLYLAALGRRARSNVAAVQGRARRRRPHHHPCRCRRVRPQRAPGEDQRPRAGSRTTPPTSIAAR